jgi:hypothetical protein
MLLVNSAGQLRGSMCQGVVKGSRTGSQILFFRELCPWAFVRLGSALVPCHAASGPYDHALKSCHGQMRDLDLVESSCCMHLGHRTTNLESRHCEFEGRATSTLLEDLCCAEDVHEPSVLVIGEAYCCRFYTLIMGGVTNTVNSIFFIT